MRVMRTLREMGIRTVAVYSDADRAAPHVRWADEAFHLGPAPSRESYLRIDRILEAARVHGAEAIHPGYGFLSENAEFAAACESAGIVFIGPPADSIRKMGSKTAARELAIAAGVPVVPGMRDGAKSPAEAREFARGCGYPVLLKAVSGGGGKGMRRVDRDEDLEAAFRDASSEAGRAFGDASVYIEKLIENPRHIEIQLLGDKHGHMIHLGERECSIQRRHQKILEECPSPLLATKPEMRQKMGEAAIRAARAAGYYNAGTAEFLVENNENFYFLEMNTRLQVEHPVTELVTGLDLVRWQVEIAAGEKLTIAQKDVAWQGAAIECRVYAEDPDNQFFPSAGRITALAEPSGPGVRLDSGIYAGWNVPLDYDPMLAKLAVWAGTREHAIARMKRAIEEYHVGGVQTNLSLFADLVSDEAFVSGELSTAFLDEFFRRRPAYVPDADVEAVAVLAAHAARPAVQAANGPASAPTSRWRASGREGLLR